MEADSKMVQRFIMALEDMIMQMQQIDNSCMDAYQDVSKREFALLVTLGRSGTMIMREVATYLRVPMSTATGIVDKLIAKNYLIRTYSPEDRRVIMVDLSKEGQAIFQSLQVRMLDFGKQMLEVFSEEQEKNTFVESMEKCASTLNCC